MKSISVFKESNGLTDVPGFECAGVACDIRNKRNDVLDVAIIYSNAPCQAAGMFTQNQVKAAPVILSQQTLLGGKNVHAVIANSGNANACTGEQGMLDAQAMQLATAAALSIDPMQVLVCSTGRIGEPLPMNKVLSGIEHAAKDLNHEPLAGNAAANAILTSDTRSKKITVSFSHKGKQVVFAGIAKGAGMIQPNMATMLAFLATDAKVTNSVLKSALKEAVGDSFNAITVDGDASTNDTVIAMANGLSSVQITKKDASLYKKFVAAMKVVCSDLAYKIVGDGERITKVVTLHIKRAKSRADAEAIARAIGNSLLVKTSWFGSDPNWGRLMDAAGYAGAELIENKISVKYRPKDSSIGSPSLAYKEGKAYPKNKPIWKEIVKEKEFTIEMDLGLGKGEFTLLATDLSTGYVDFNKSE